MKRIKVLFVSCFIGFTLSAVAQKSSTDEKPKFGFLQCRADAQKWTVDLDNPKFPGVLLVYVNGQLRGLPHVTFGVTMANLMQRTYEADVCKREDADFEKQYSTYSALEDTYTEEQLFRYKNFLMKHHLDEQFTKEDSEQFK